MVYRPFCKGCGLPVGLRPDGKPYEHRMPTPTGIPSDPDTGTEPWCPGLDEDDDQTLAQVKARHSWDNWNEEEIASEMQPWPKDGED